MQLSMLRIWTWVNSDHLLQLVLHLHNKIEKFVTCLCNNMSLSRRCLTYGMAFPLLNIGILQSMKHIRKSNFLKIQNSQATARYGVWKNTSFDNRKSSIKIYLSCLRKRTNVYNSEDMSFSFCLSQLLILFPLLYGLLKVRESFYTFLYLKEGSSRWLELNILQMFFRKHS